MFRELNLAFTVNELRSLRLTLEYRRMQLKFRVKPQFQGRFQHFHTMTNYEPLRYFFISIFFVQFFINVCLFRLKSHYDLKAFKYFLWD